MLVGENILLRSLKDSDLEFLIKIENNEDLWKFGSERKRFSKEELISYISNSNTDISIAGQYRFVIEAEKKAVGFIDLFNYKIPVSDIGIIIAEPFRGKGYAKQALVLLSNYAFNNFKLNQINCKISQKNFLSIKLFLSCGFIFFNEQEGYNHYVLKNNI